ncbi:Mannosyltransferase [Pleurostoma richardsiae]|uniref:Mannosyltransferase n=1 Tax=Pleurostoma richardsiae TaxID=41990 RepID=A0AA38S2F8_9PEZI|nr:Mannosyltransferase [Pleurostoma richardsiae]
MTGSAAQSLRREKSSAVDAPLKLHPDVLAAHTRDILTVLLALRFVNALCIRTFFQPDEYFQALEPAWKIAFGPDSGAWLTWEWQYHLRSSLHPALFGVAYMIVDKILELFQAFSPFRAFILSFLPKILQSVFAGLGDFYTWKLAEKIYGQQSRAASAALWLTILNPWQWYCSTRTFSNSIETTLTVAALYYWPWQLAGDASANPSKVLGEKRSMTNLRISLLLAAIAVVLRPTNLLIWLAIVTLSATRMTLDGKSPLSFDVLAVLVRESVICGCAVLALSAVSDRLYFGSWTFPPYHWLHFNLSQDLAVFYGHMPWHYYLSQGIPLLTTTFLPFALLGLYKSSSPSSSELSVSQSNTLRVLSFAVITTVSTLSLISHKEVRFVYPLLPILHVLAAPYFGDFSAASSSPTQSRPLRKPLLALILFVNLILAGYLSLFHQPAPVSVVTFLRTEYERLHPSQLSLHPAGPAPIHYHSAPQSSAALSSPALDPLALSAAAANGTELFALFLTPCHSTPWRSHLIYPTLRARALTCEPPLHTAPRSAERETYLDEADRFYRAAEGGSWGRAFLAEEMWPLLTGGDDDGRHVRGGEVPRYIVGFEGIEGLLEGFFAPDGEGKDMGVQLERVWEGRNGLFNEDWRRRGLLVVWDTGVYHE